MVTPGNADWDPFADETVREAVEGRSEETYLAVRAGEGTYALPVVRVVEILRHAEPTPLPAMPAFLGGVVELRGKAIPILDLGLRLSGRPLPGTGGPVVVVTLGERCLGLRVDGLLGLKSVVAGTVQPLPDELPVAGRGFVAGVLPGSDGRFTVVLEIDRLLRVEEEASLDQVASAARGTPSG